MVIKSEFNLEQKKSAARWIIIIISSLVLSYGWTDKETVRQMLEVVGGFVGILGVFIWSLWSNRYEGWHMLGGIFRQTLTAASVMAIYFNWIPAEQANELVGAVIALVMLIWGYDSNIKNSPVLTEKS